jgi:hypothetical protein
MKLKTFEEKLFALYNIIKIIGQLNENEIYVCEMNLDKVFIIEENKNFKIILENDCISEIETFSRRNRLLFEYNQSSIDCFCVSNLFKFSGFHFDFDSFFSVKDFLSFPPLLHQISCFSGVSFHDFIKIYM